jgi:hypothetical protein
MRIIVGSVVQDVMLMPLNGFYPLFLQGLSDLLLLVQPDPPDRLIRRLDTSTKDSFRSRVFQMKRR